MPHISQNTIPRAPGGRRESMPGSYPLTSPCVLWLACLHSQAYHILKINTSLKHVKMGKLRQENGK